MGTIPRKSEWPINDKGAPSGAPLDPLQGWTFAPSALVSALLNALLVGL